MLSIFEGQRKEVRFSVLYCVLGVPIERLSVIQKAILWLRDCKAPDMEKEGKEGKAGKAESDWLLRISILLPKDGNSI